MDCRISRDKYSIDFNPLKIKAGNKYKVISAGKPIGRKWGRKIGNRQF